MDDRRGIRRLFRLPLHDRRTTHRDVEEEIRLHVELRTEELVAAGMEPRRARCEAERLFASGRGTLEALHRTALDRSGRMGRRAMVEAWWRDARHAARGLARDRVLAAFVITTLGLGMGATLTSFSLADRLLLRDPPHLRAPEELVRIFGTTLDDAGVVSTRSWIPHSVYTALRDELSGVDGMGAYRVTPQIVGRGLEARTRRVGQTLDGYFPVLGARPLLGRYFTPDEIDDAVAELAVVNEGYWREAMGADPSAVGGTVAVGGRSYTVVGVAPADFSGTELRRVDVWIPADRSRADNTLWQVIARLRPGVEAGALASEATALHARSADELQSWFRWFEDATVSAGSINLDYDGSRPFEATMAGWLAVMAALIMLVALGNVANLLLARLARRRRELAVRVVLGSGRGGIVRLLGLEGLTLAAAAGVLGVAVMGLTEPLLRASLLAGEAPWTPSLADARLLGALVALVLVTALGIAAAPAMQAGGDRLAVALRTGGAGGGGRGARLRASLTVLQAAFSVVLLVGAGLFLTSLARVRALDLGVDVARVLVVEAHLPPVGEDRLRHERVTYERLARRVRGLPGVDAAAMAIGTPLDGGTFGVGVHVPGRDSVPSLPGGGPFASAVGPGYFATVGTPFLAGRTFTEADAEGAEPVLIVNHTLARTLWPGGEAVGRCVSLGRAEDRCRRVVGLVADIHRVGIDDQPAMQVYMAAPQQEMFGGARILVRPSSASPVTPAALRQALMEEEPGLRLVEVERLSAALDDELRPLRLGMVSFGLSGLLALVVAALGLYSVMAYMVAWRTHEIGVRSALGATRSQISRMIVRSGTAMAGAGIVLGLALAFYLARWLEPHLFRTQAGEPAVFAAVAATLLLVSLVAGWIPSRRAARISPKEALLGE